MEADERKRHTFVTALNTIRNEKTALRKTKKAERKQDLERKNAQADKAIEEARKLKKKRQYRSEGKADAARERKRMKSGS